MPIKEFRERVMANGAAMRINKEELQQLEQMLIAKRNGRAARRSEERKKRTTAALKAENVALKQRCERLAQINAHLEERLLRAATSFPPSDG